MVYVGQIGKDGPTIMQIIEKRALIDLLVLRIGQMNPSFLPVNSNDIGALRFALKNYLSILKTDTRLTDLRK